ncbi:MAG: diguanylate cyclase [Alphaproteobacteria bacterium]|nr:diguanylate cyclase [Alphaproteobacteria bacterium]MBV8549397.1 diguanylate cyclase [Alphaproteobacteria bacterium]
MAYTPDQWALQAFERLKRDGLVPTPNNYAIYYYYFAGSNPRLRTAVDIFLSKQPSLTQDNCNELYQTHLGIDAEHKMLQEANASIESEVNRMLDMIDRASNDANQYSETLDDFSGTLTSGKSMEQIREAVTKVAAETLNMSAQNERLAAQLAEATQQLSEMRTSFDQIHRESQIDPLTEVGNRKFFDKELIHTTAEARDNAAPLSLLMVDIDHFKKFNDSYGHQIGDQVLRLVARTLVENLKGRDVIARYGGEEFVILLAQTRLQDAERVANLLRSALSTKQIKKRSTNETLGVITVSIGAAEYCPGEDMESFIGRADSGLYKAKGAGRNQVICETLPDAEAAAIKARRKVF